MQSRRKKALTPYIVENWEQDLLATGLIHRYPSIPSSLSSGFDAGIPSLSQTYTPANHPSTTDHPAYLHSVVLDEFNKQRYIGPFSRTELEAEIGPFQTSPISIIPKPGQPGKFRLIQNLSYPRHKTPASINSFIDAALFPCTWGMFATMSVLISSLPNGTQAAVRDVAEAYRTIPIKPSQWPGLVVRLAEEDQYAVDTCCCFGLTSSAGVHGVIGDARADLMQARGIGPIAKWVDDHIFFRLPRNCVEKYNNYRSEMRLEIIDNRGRQQQGGRIWYAGRTWSNGRIEEWHEDMHFPIKNFSPKELDQTHAYTMDDIDDVSTYLGIPWKRSKDVPFADVVEYIGLRWDLQARTVSLLQRKLDKYKRAIEE